MAEQARMMGKFRASNDTLNTNNTTNKISKRNRQPLSCLPCRQKKLKCDRAHPCETCVKRNEESTCIYNKVPNSTKGDAASRIKAQDRLRQLEHLVMQMVDANGTPKTDDSSKLFPTPSTTLTEETSGDGHLEPDGKYAGSTHWSAILENINELKTAMADEAPESPDNGEAEDTDASDQEILFGSRRGLSIQLILAQHLPLRIHVDRLLSTYFNAKYSVLPYIHTYRFQKQYEQVWTDPFNLDVLWYSILFSICCIASQLTAATASTASTQDTAKAQIKSFLTASAQCLVLGGYTLPKPYVVEALALHSQCIYNSSLDPSREVSIIFPLLIRLAYRMGYHRDPSHFPATISIFDGEMRRRVWTMCRQFDLMISFQLGLPNCIPLDSYDTLPPRNLLDADFSEDTTILPPSRPENEATQILYFIVKSRLMNNFGRVCNHALSFKPTSQSEIMVLDADVRRTFATVPDILRIRPMKQSFADPPYLLMVRLNCKFLYEKSLIVLHRKYMTQAEDAAGGEYAFSTKACIDSAMAICACFVDMNKEFERGGRLWGDRWMLTSFTMNDFFLACMVLCAALSLWRKGNRGSGMGIEGDKVAWEWLEMVRTAEGICRERGEGSREARMVGRGLRVMLGKFPGVGGGGGNGGLAGGDGERLGMVDDAAKAGDKAGHAAVVGWSYRGFPTGSTVTPPQEQPQQPQQQQQQQEQRKVVNLTPLSLNESGAGAGAGSDLGLFENFLEGTENIDWQLLDQYLVNSERYDDVSNYDMEDINVVGTNGIMDGDGSGEWQSTAYRFLGGQNGLCAGGGDGGDVDGSGDGGGDGGGDGYGS